MFILRRYPSYNLIQFVPVCAIFKVIPLAEKDTVKKPEKSVREQLDALDSVLGVDQSTNSDNFLDRMELLPFRATRKRDAIEKSALRPFNYGEGDDTRINNVCSRHNLLMYRQHPCMQLLRISLCTYFLHVCIV